MVGRLDSPGIPLLLGGGEGLMTCYYHEGTVGDDEIDAKAEVKVQDGHKVSSSFIEECFCHVVNDLGFEGKFLMFFDTSGEWIAFDLYGNREGER